MTRLLAFSKQKTQDAYCYSRYDQLDQANPVLFLLEEKAIAKLRNYGSSLKGFLNQYAPEKLEDTSGELRGANTPQEKASILSLHARRQFL